MGLLNPIALMVAMILSACSEGAGQGVAPLYPAWAAYSTCSEE